MRTPEGEGGFQEQPQEWSPRGQSAEGQDPTESLPAELEAQRPPGFPQGRRARNGHNGHNGHNGPNGDHPVGEIFRGTEEFIEHEFEESPELGFRIARKAREIIVNIPIAGKIIESTAKFTGRVAKKIYASSQERKIDRIVRHPKSIRNRFSRRTIVRHGFQEAMPNWFERLDINHPKISKGVKGSIATLKFISLVPFFTLPAGIPGTPIQLPNPILSLIFQRTFPFLINQSATVALNAGKVIRALARRELLGVVAYGVPGVLDTFLPFFNTVLLTPAIDAGIGRHYAAQAGKFFDKAGQEIATQQRTDLTGLMRRDVRRVGKHYAGILGVARSEISLAGLHQYFSAQETHLQTPISAPVLKDVAGLSWIRSVIPKVQNKLAQMDYSSRENRRLQRIEAGRKLRDFIGTVMSASEN